MPQFDLPATMRAMHLMGFGDVDQLQLADVPRPEPLHSEVLIKVGACGINNTDLNLRKGWYSQDTANQSGWQGTPPPFPIIQGADIVGTIVAVGEGVPANRIGERVMVNPTIYNDHPDNPLDIDFLGSERPGGFAEFVCAPAENAYKVTTPMSDAELATFATSYLTAWHMLERARVVAGETVLITGASGGVGSALVQLVQARGASAIAIVGRNKMQQAQALGATKVVARDDDVTVALAGMNIDAVADVVGGASIVTLMDVVRLGGRIVTAGAIAGAKVEIDLRTLYLHQISLIGSTLGTASDFANLVATIEAGNIKPLLAHAFPLEQLCEAQTTFDAKQFFGKLVIVVD